MNNGQGEWEMGRSVPRKTRVLFLLPQLDAGGSERVVFDLARSLDSSRFDVFVAAFKAGVLVEPLKTICRDVFVIDKRPGFDFSAMVKVARIVKEHGIDVINAHHYMPCFYSFFGTRVMNGKKLIYTEHSVPEVENIAGCFHGKIFHCLLYRIDAVVGVSRAIAEKFRVRYSRHAQKVHEIVNGVDIEKFRTNGSRKIIRSRWGLADELFVVGTVANFRKVKNHICLVRAAGRLKDTHPHLRFVFVGTGFPGDAENSEEEVRSLIRGLGIQDRVILAGYQENIPVILSSFDAFCLPSLSEGLPISALEAMAAGIPFIGSNVSGIVEVVQDGKTGMLFPSDNDYELSRRLAEVSKNPCMAQEFVDNAFIFVKTFHDIRIWKKEYGKVLELVGPTR